MSLARLVNAVKTDSVIPYMICEYSADGVGADSSSSELIELELPSMNLNRWGHRNIPNNTVNGEAYAIKLAGLAFSCDSTNFTFIVLNKSDITLLDTTNEVIKYIEVDKTLSDQSFDEFIIRNRDNSLTNKLYIYINNPASISTGTIRIEFVYIAIQDREF